MKLKKLYRIVHNIFIVATTMCAFTFTLIAMFVDIDEIKHAAGFLVLLGISAIWTLLFLYANQEKLDSLNK